MTTTQAAFDPLTTLIDSVRTKSEADSAAIKALEKELGTAKRELQEVKTTNVDQAEAISQLKKDMEALRALVEKHTTQIGKLDDSSISHQAQLDSVVADHRRKRDRSPAPGPEAPACKPKNESLGNDAPPNPQGRPARKPRPPRKSVASLAETRHSPAGKLAPFTRMDC